MVTMSKFGFDGVSWSLAEFMSFFFSFFQLFSTFFFKQKTAYEIMPSLVGSEMCIRDSNMHRTAKERERGGDD